MDSNHDKELQRLLCYHYTTGQDGDKLAVDLGWRKAKRPFYGVRVGLHPYREGESRRNEHVVALRAARLDREPP
jgi:hypothetical protein